MKWRRRSSRKQQRGGGWGFNGPAFTPAGGMAPESARAWTDDCAYPARPSPQVGGACGSCGPMFAQSGGACNCAGGWGQRGGGSGTGGYGFDLTDNSMLKSYASLSQGSCPQKGGNRPDEIVAYPAGYDLGRAVALDSGARYLDPIPYNRSCSGGARRTRKGRKGRRSAHRSSRKGRRSTHRK